MINFYEYAQCPGCGKTAQGEDEIEINFGYRTLEGGKQIPHSWCRECRDKYERTKSDNH